MNKKIINEIIHGDCLEEMNFIDDKSIDLIYLDPPFFTEKKHILINKEKNKEFSFDDKWITNNNYASFLKDRIEKMRNLLKDEGTIFVHCDKNAQHIVRAILDNVFGTENFQSEIIWTYKRWSNSKQGLLSSHQTIYFYSKTNKFKFNTIYTPYSETTNVDQILQKRTRDKYNKSIYDIDTDGNFRHGSKKKGVPLNDVWDIPYLNPKAKERVGYPTQKPLLLLERIVKIASNEEDTVLDPFCGSGTTCVAAKLLNRNFIGIDKSEDAVQLSRDRTKKPIKTESNLLKNGRNSYLTANQEALMLLSGLKYNPVQRNKGIDAILIDQYAERPVFVKVQRSQETLTEAAILLAKAMKSKGSLKSILIQTNENTLFEENIDIDGIDLIKAPSLQIKSIIKDKKNYNVS